MPTVMRIGSWRFHFYSDEGMEPPHIHVDIGDSECKLWLAPVRVAQNRGVAAVELRRIERAAMAHEVQLLEAWHGFFNR